MGFFLKFDGFFVRLGEHVVEEDLDYNPYAFGDGIVGFYLRGDSVLPVVDLHEVLKANKGKRKVFLISDGAVFILFYDTLSKEPEGVEVDLKEIERDVRERLDGRS